MNPVPLIPPVLTKIGGSTKAVNLYLYLGVVLMWKELGLADAWMWPVTAAFCAWVISQGMSDFGKCATKAAKGAKDAKPAANPPAAPPA